MQSRRLEMLIKILIGITFFVPLIVLPSSYIFPFIVPKIVWFRSLTLLLLGAYILLLISNFKEYRPKFTPTTVAVLLFFLSFAVSTFVGVDWYRSFWDNHERMLGLFTIFHFVAFYLVVTSVVKEKKDWLWLLRTFLFAGSLVMFIGLLQRANPELLLNNGSDRVSATLGNSIYFSGYGLFLFFVGLYLFLQEKKWNVWKYSAMLGAMLGFWGIFGGGTRGTLLGLLAGLFVLGIGYLVTLKEYKKIRITIACFLGFIVLLGGFSFIYRQTNFVSNIPAVGRLVNTTIDPHNPRVMAWGIAWQAFLEKPVFGWGPNNYYYAFNEYYRPEFLESGWGETWFDNAHNIVMNTLAVQGAIGLVLYFGLFGATIFILWWGYKKGESNVHLTVVGTAFLAAHFVHNITVFENPTSYLYFFFFLALVNQSADSSYQITDNKLKKVETNSASISWIIFVSLLTLLLIYSTDINPAKANKATLNTIRALYSDPIKAIDLYNSASNIVSPHIDDIRNDFARTAMEQIYKLAENKQPDKALKLFNLIHGELQKNLVLHPLDIRIHVQLAQLDTVGAQLKQDANLFFEADGLMEEALKMSPKRQQLQYTLAGFKMQLNQPEKAVELLKASVDNDEKIAEGWWRLALIYNQIGDSKKAKETILTAQNKGIVFDGQGAEVAKMIMSTPTKK